MEPASLTFGAETSSAGGGGATHIKTLIHLIDEAHLGWMDERLRAELRRQERFVVCSMCGRRSVDRAHRASRRLLGRRDPFAER